MTDYEATSTDEGVPSTEPNQGDVPSEVSDSDPSLVADAPAQSEGDGDLPPQRHAGKVGYGPNYQSGPSVGDKITGVKEQVLGKVKNDPDLVQKGQDRLDGTLKEKEQAEEDSKSNPFATA